MADFSVKIDTAILQRVIADAPVKADQLIRALAFDGMADVQRSFGTSPSAEGNPPGVDTGALKNSINVKPVAPFVQSINTGVDYDVHLEFGTSRMAARPFMSPMARRLEDKIPAFFKNWID